MSIVMKTISNFIDHCARFWHKRVSEFKFKIIHKIIEKLLKIWKIKNKEKKYRIFYNKSKEMNFLFIE